MGILEHFPWELDQVGMKIPIPNNIFHQRNSPSLETFPQAYVVHRFVGAWLPALFLEIPISADSSFVSSQHFHSVSLLEKSSPDLG